MDKCFILLHHEGNKRINFFLLLTSPGTEKRPVNTGHNTSSNTFCIGLHMGSSTNLSVIFRNV